MSRAFKRRRLRAAVAVVIVSAVAGCGSAGPIKVSSEPSGAKVLASGRELGATPLTIHPDDVFPPRFVGGGYRAAGELRFAMGGCKDRVLRVNDSVLSRDIQVALDCEAAPAAAPQVPAAAPTAVPAPAPAPRPDGRTVRERLETVDALRRDGVITEEEYERIRTRILESL